MKARKAQRLRHNDIRFQNNQAAKKSAREHRQSRKDIRTKEGRGLKAAKAVGDVFKTFFNSELAKQAGAIARGLRGTPQLNVGDVDL